MSPAPQPPRLLPHFLRPGMRIAVACSGGADSVALLRTLLEQREALGLVLSVAHMNHGLRGAESEADEAFVASLAARFDLPFHTRRVDTASIAQSHREGIEESARKLRYQWFWELLAAREADALATAHTLDDQAETVLHRLIRGAWTEGLGGIHPVLQPPPQSPSGQSGMILRPFLGTTRAEIEPWLAAIGQSWREDSTNADTAFTRNRLRHELLPQLAGYNPAIKKQLAQLSTLARDEEAWWQAELSRLLPSLLLPGKAVRGGGRATATLPGTTSISIEIERLKALHPALRRRVLRAAAARLQFAIDFEETERLLELCGLREDGQAFLARNSSKLQLKNGLRAERTPREIRLAASEAQPLAAGAVYELPIPGAVDAPAYGLRLQASIGAPPTAPLSPATLRPSRPGDRVRLRHSRSALKLSEAYRRVRLDNAKAAASAVLEWRGEIVWAPGMDVESAAAREAVLVITESPLE